MSALQQILDRGRAESGHTSPLCHSLEAHATALVVVLSATETWLLPWHHLSAARLFISDARDELRLTFTDYEVTLLGRRLAVLGELIATGRLGAVRAAPARYAKSTDTEPFIESLRLRALDED